MIEALAISFVLVALTIAIHYEALRLTSNWLVDLPEPYLVWFSRQGFPSGRLGDMLREVYEIKRNGLEYLFKTDGVNLPE